jgi:hypothetical protein
MLVCQPMMMRECLFSIHSLTYFVAYTEKLLYCIYYIQLNVCILYIVSGICQEFAFSVRYRICC